MPRGIKTNNPDALKKTLLAWLRESVGGSFSAACQHVNVSRTVGYEWRRDDTDFDRAVADAVVQSHTNGGDFAESKLMQAIGKGELTAVLFYLKTVHKKRGYVERQETDHGVRPGGFDEADDGIIARALALLAQAKGG